jgi:hypothetical protein
MSLGYRPDPKLHLTLRRLKKLRRHLFAGAAAALDTWLSDAKLVQLLIVSTGGSMHSTALQWTVVMWTVVWQMARMRLCVHTMVVGKIMCHIQCGPVRRCFNLQKLQCGPGCLRSCASLSMIFIFNQSLHSHAVPLGCAGAQWNDYAPSEEAAGADADLGELPLNRRHCHVPCWCAADIAQGNGCKSGSAMLMQPEC